MPGDPKQCREHAKRWLALASEITNPVLKESLTDAAQRWALLATELETIHASLSAPTSCPCQRRRKPVTSRTTGRKGNGPSSRGRFAGQECQGWRLRHRCRG